ncbi:SpoIVB peptidase [Halanaerocella petrolearia]
MKKHFKFTTITLALVLALILSFPTLMSFLGLPNYCQIIKGSEQYLNTDLPVEVLVSSRQAKNLKINGHKLTQEGMDVNLSSPLAIQASSLGQYNLKFHLFGFIPIQKMRVNVIPKIKVIPGGHSIGVILRSEGIMVVKNSYVKTKAGKKKFPAQEAGIEVGDSLLELNGISIKNKHHLAQLIHKFGQQKKKVKFKIKKQDGKIIFKKVKPVKNKDGYYMIGIYVDDGAAGVGTMSFYEPESGYYGALGHMITEANTQRKINVGQGEIVKANISGINRGHEGTPGEKLGTFFNDEGVLGEIFKNNRFGIYGKLSVKPRNPYFNEPIPIASATEVKRGAANIYTVITGKKIEKFKVRIERVRRQKAPAEKGLIVKIVDSELLNRTGGIIQGMSGSPIVQDGKLVGIVTHVFVNDSTRGYGILAQWMVMESGLIKEKNHTRELAS